MIPVSNETFGKLVVEPSLKRPVVIDMWAEWCGPCKIFAPIYEKVSKDYSSDMDFYKLNVDDNPEISDKYGIKSIPTVLIFYNSEPVAQISGLIAEDNLRHELEYVLALTQN
tara:strand:- start:121 stop:456 length:336 start_codon:yes stop_codon:yes gene_type:complete